MTRTWVVAIGCAVAVASRAAAADDAAVGEWRQARWGITADEVQRRFPEAARLEPPERLADGNVVALWIPEAPLGRIPFQARFVFGPRGGLALVSLRTPRARDAGPEDFEAAKAALVAELGPPAEASADDAVIDLRQVTWRGPRGRVDLKYIPGVVVVLHSAPARPPGGEP